MRAQTRRGLSKSSTSLPWPRALGCRFGWRRCQGEALDSWLELTARRMDLPLGAVAGALDLPIVTRPTWTRWLSLDQLEAIEAATGVSSTVVEAMTLSVYDGTALQLDPDSHRLDPAFPFGALPWSRFLRIYVLLTLVRGLPRGRYVSRRHRARCPTGFSRRVERRRWRRRWREPGARSRRGRPQMNRREPWSARRR
ncbi:MAG: hypothetical protein JWR48_7144 [Mycobacterium sp.]|jgi:hypothetical protein|nr:hypothetical protein [Mycobacterium sp.]